MADMQATGLGAASKLPLIKLLDDLTAVQMQRLKPMEQQKTAYEAQLSAFGLLKSALENVSTAATTLSQPATLNATVVTSSSTAFSAAVTGNASAGNYQIKVSSLAQAQSLRTAGQTSSSAMLGTLALSRTLTISQPAHSPPLVVTLNDSQTSLDAVAAAINRQQGSVSAAVIQDSDGKYYLTLGAKESGTQSAMTVSVTGDNSLAAVLNYSNSPVPLGNMSVAVAATDALFTFNGIGMDRQSNTITDLPPGVVVILKALSPGGNPEALQIEHDTAPVQQAFGDFVTAYNALLSSMTSLTQYVPVQPGQQQSPDNGALIGNITLRQMKEQLKDVITGSYGRVPYGPNEVHWLSDLGITADRTGMLVVNSGKLAHTVLAEPVQVNTFLIGANTTLGLATKMSLVLKQFLSPYNGTIKIATESLVQNITTVDKQIAQATQVVESNMSNMRKQFAALDVMVEQLNNTSKFLTEQFKNMNRREG